MSKGVNHLTWLNLAPGVTTLPQPSAPATVVARWRKGRHRPSGRYSLIYSYILIVSYLLLYSAIPAYCPALTPVRLKGHAYQA
jgi:hypothetical protein